MELTLLNTDLKSVAIIDTFQSLIWKDRYCGFGDFEIVSPMSSDFLGYVTEDYYLSLRDSSHTMIVESINVHSDSESGDTAIIKGQSLESILDRRIVWDQTILTGNFQDGIEKLLNENAINPTIPERKIALLEFLPSEDPVITEMTINAQLKGVLLGKAITDLCLEKGLGYIVYLSEDKHFVFSLIVGSDRSYSQVENPYVTFSSNFENIVHSDYIESTANLRTVALVAGEPGVGNGKKEISVDSTNGAGTDVNRREIYVEASDLTRTVTINGKTTTVSEEDYLKQLKQRGLEVLAKYVFVKTFEGQVDTTQMYVYGQDFLLGDFVEVVDGYGHEAKSQVLELIFSEDKSGIRIYPTFGAVP